MVMTSNDPVRSTEIHNTTLQQATARNTPVRVGGGSHVVAALWNGTLLFTAQTPIPNDDGLVLTSEVEARVASTTRGIVLQSGWAGIKAAGATLPQAQANFLIALRDRYLALNEAKEKGKRLSARDRATLETLRGILTKPEA